MIRMAVAIALMGLVGCTPVPQKAKAPAKPADPVKAISAFLWPAPKPQPVDVVMPRPRPTIERPATKAKPRKATRQKIRTAPRQTVQADDGPDLPYPCWLVRLHAAGKTTAQLEAMARANNINLSAKQRRQGAACLRGRR